MTDDAMLHAIRTYFWRQGIDNDTPLNEIIRDYEDTGWTFKGIVIHPMGDMAAMMTVMFETRRETQDDD